MEIERIEPAREFRPRPDSDISIAHVADVTLSSGELLSFLSESGTQLDVLRTVWGYVATPSLNRRLRDRGLHGCLVQNQEGRLYLLLVEEKQRSSFDDYLRDTRQRVVCWLDSDAAVQRVVDALEK